MKIRSITLFAELHYPWKNEELTGLGEFAQSARTAFTQAGLEVQTLRLALQARPSGGDLVARGTSLEPLAQEAGFGYTSLGPLPRSHLERLPDLLEATESIFGCAHLVEPESATIDGAMVRACARVMRKAAAIEEGFGNLRFAALANVAPGVPFFPAAYHQGGPPTFAIATQAADLAVEACRDAQDAHDARKRLTAAIEREAARITDVAMQLRKAPGPEGVPAFGGIDFSLAPFPTPEASIGAALEALTGRPLGAPGTLAAAATLTSAIDAAPFAHTGFCGLMLPVLEDPVLGQRSAEGRLGLGELLQWSAVCGTGLDTVPLPGDASEEALAQILFDVAALAVRLHKPLTARLMPLPGKAAGAPVHFDFAYFADGGVLSLEPAEGAGLLSKTTRLHLKPRIT